MWRGLVDLPLRFVAATIAGVVPFRHWRDLEPHVPVSRAALASALATFLLAAVIGIPGYFRHAEANAGRAIDLTLQATGWRPAESGAAPPSDATAGANWAASFLSLFTFAFLTPIGLFTSYLGLTGLFRVVSVAAGEPRGDPVLTVIDAAGVRLWRASVARRARRIREALEGPEVPDRLVPGRAAGFPDADFVVVASRRKPDWEAGVFVITQDTWYRLGTPVERQLPGGLRTLYPLTELLDFEVLRRSVRYELPPVSAALSKPDER